MIGKINKTSSIYIDSKNMYYLILLLAMIIDNHNIIVKKKEKKITFVIQITNLSIINLI